MRVVFAALFWLFLALPGLAVEPGEQLDDPALEARARAISALLRCPQCQSENIDNSNAMIARDIRLFVRERLLAGDDDEMILDALAARYGEFVLFLPKPTGVNWLLWGGGPAVLCLGLLLAWLTVRKKTEDSALSPEEQAAFDRLTKG